MCKGKYNSKRIKANTCKGRYNSKYTKKNMMVNAQRKIQWQIYKKKYDSSLGNCKWRKALNTTEEIKIKHKTEFIVILNANKYYMDLFYYLF